MDNLYILEYGLSPPEIKLELHDGMPLRFFTKDQFGYYMFKGFNTKYGGFRQLKITIPKKLYTTSLNPKGQNRILKITKDNIDKYKEFIKNYLSNDPTLYKYISKKNIIGLVDMRFGEEHVNGKLWEFPDIINFGGN